jgi:hypothetical protein
MISEWFDRGVAQGATHLIVVCDDFASEDYPVFVMSDDNVREVEDRYDNPREMSRVMEVYWLEGDKIEQLAKERSFTYGP